MGSGKGDQGLPLPVSHSPASRAVFCVPLSNFDSLRDTAVSCHSIADL